MGMLQATSFNVRPTAGTHQLIVKGRRSRPRRIALTPLGDLKSDRSVAPLQMSNELAVVQQAIAGNAEAQERLFARHTEKLYRIAFGVLRNKEDAEDALQDGLCQAYTSLRSFQGRSSFSSWLTRIVINAALMIRRRNNFHPEASWDEMQERTPEGSPHGAVDSRPDPEKICAAMEFDALLEKQVCLLPRTLQAAFRLRVLNG